MTRADGWFICRVGLLETARAVGLAGSAVSLKAARSDWTAFGVVEIDLPLIDHATDLALTHALGSLDALHLAAALVLPPEDLVFTAWDRRLHQAAQAEGLAVMPDTVPRS